MKGMSGAVRHAEHRINRLIAIVDRRDKTGKREEEENDKHLTKVDADGSRQWSY